ncbi:MAG: VOC family protein [Gammaproteobacteria bacterium]|nr:VOC family protein [Gammaproteobacteria bacterium]
MLAIDYIEIPVHDLQAAKQFYGDLFGWTFVDYGEQYTAFSHARGQGGFNYQEKPSVGGVLIVLYSENLQETFNHVARYGAPITKFIFDFPGGRRFQFRDPSGHELAVWSEQ